MSTRAIAPIIGAAHSTVVRGLNSAGAFAPPEPKPVTGVPNVTPEPKPVTGMDGKTYLPRPSVVDLDTAST